MGNSNWCLFHEEKDDDPFDYIPFEIMTKEELESGFYIEDFLDKYDEPEIRGDSPIQIDNFFGYKFSDEEYIWQPEELLRGYHPVKWLKGDASGPFESELSYLKWLQENLYWKKLTQSINKDLSTDGYIYFLPDWQDQISSIELEFINKRIIIGLGKDDDYLVVSFHRYEFSVSGFYMSMYSNIEDVDENIQSNICALFCIDRTVVPGAMEYVDTEESIKDMLLLYKAKLDGYAIVYKAIVAACTSKEEIESNLKDDIIQNHLNRMYTIYGKQFFLEQ